MAVLIPDIPKDCPVGERVIYERLGRDLPSDWVVLHSLGLPGHETKIWGEADIVVLSNVGIFAIEVKGGQVSCRDGVWTYEGVGFAAYTKREDPWTQAKGTMMAIRTQLQAADPAFEGVLFGFGVAMPHTRFSGGGIEVIPEVLLDNRHARKDMASWLRQVAGWWETDLQQRLGRRMRGLDKGGIRRAREILRPDLETSLSLGGVLTGVEGRIIHLTQEQIRAARRIAANPRSVVRGQAGTGKSVLAVERARQLATEGQRVLFLCFNRLLAAHVKAGLDHPGITVRTIHGLEHDVIRMAGLPLPAEEPRDDFFLRRLPEAAAEVLLTKGMEPWDVLVVDEAQDILTPAHLDVLDLVLERGLRDGRWHLFLDPLQNIFAVEVQEEAVRRLEEGRPAYDDLFENCRNTRQVAAQASLLSGVDLAMEGAPDGPDCANVWYSSEEECIAKLEQIVGRLLRDGVAPQDIAILSPRRRENSVLARQGQVAGVLLLSPEEIMGGGKGVVFATMQAFKGLERQVILAVDMEDVGDADHRLLHYAGLSRARGLLRTFLPENARRSVDRQAADFARRMMARTS